uniref:Ig-like domain-containing protein n=1 Tax=Anabas testudineus TaxID=64144 RepID=A0A3Q1I544_ANATE
TEPQPNMEKKTKMMVFCLLLSVICSPVLTGEWKAEVVQKLDALVSSCIVIPCTFTYPENNLPRSKLRGIWHLKSDKNQRVYHEDNTRVLENFRGRTKLLGNLGQNNCTLEITEIEDHGNGPYCFRIELAENEDPTINKFSFVEDCAALNVLPDPPLPELIYSETAFLGTPYTITCKVFHTCPSHSPTLKWSRVESFMEHHRKLPYGLWEVESIITLIPEEKDDHKEVTCTATFNGQRTSSNKFKLRVKRTLNYNHIIIPIVVAIGTSVTFGILFVFIVKRYKRRIAELQSQDGR